MELRKIFNWALYRLYYFGASIVILGLVLDNLGSKHAKTITLIGLLTECLIFFFSGFLSEDYNDIESANKETDGKKKEERFKKIYYTDGNGYYFLDKPAAYQGAILPNNQGFGGVLPVVNSNSGIPNHNANMGSIYLPDITSEIKRLKEQIEFLESARAEQIENYMSEKNNTNNENGESYSDSFSKRKISTSESKKNYSDSDVNTSNSPSREVASSTDERVSERRYRTRLKRLELLRANRASKKNEEN